MKYVLGIDISTTITAATLIDETGKIIKRKVFFVTRADGKQTLPWQEKMRNRADWLTTELDNWLTEKPDKIVCEYPLTYYPGGETNDQSLFAMFFIQMHVIMYFKKKWNVDMRINENLALPDDYHSIIHHPCISS